MIENNESNPYHILRLNPNSVTIDELKTSFRKLALLYHPDKCKDKKDIELFEKIKSSYHQILNQLNGKLSHYTHDSLKNNFENYKPTNEQNSKISNTTLDPSKFNIDDFNDKFVKQHHNNSDLGINSEINFDRKKNEYFLEKSNLENQINQYEKIFENSSSYDNNTFNKYFEFINGSKEVRSKELAKHSGNSDPIPVSNSIIDKYSSSVDTVGAKNEPLIIDVTYSKLNDNAMGLSSNPIKINQEALSLINVDKNDVTKVDVIPKENYIKLLNQKLKEYQTK